MSELPISYGLKAILPEPGPAGNTETFMNAPATSLPWSKGAAEAAASYYNWATDRTWSLNELGEVKEVTDDFIPEP